MTKQLIEASKISPDSLTGAVWRVKILEGDKDGSSAYYPKETLQEGAHLFAEKTKIYLNHPTADDKFNQPERRVQDIVGYLSENATFDGKDLYANATFLPKYQQEIKDLAEAGLIGMSIRAEGEVSEASGKKTLVKFTRVHSVDVVTEAGAGGGFDKLLESAKVSASESGAESLEEMESIMDPKLEAALDALVESAKANTATLKTLTERAAKEDKDKADLAEAARLEAAKPKEIDPLAVVATLAEAKLVPASQARVLDAVKGGKELAEAITAEQDYVKAIQEAAPKFAGNGSEEITEAAGSQIGVSMFGAIS